MCYTHTAPLYYAGADPTVNRVDVLLCVRPYTTLVSSRARLYAYNGRLHLLGNSSVITSAPFLCLDKVGGGGGDQAGSKKGT